jgi:RNA-directed DNA polymerase
MNETQSSGDISTRIEWIAELARKHPGRSLTSLHHVIDMEWMKEAAKRVRKDAAVGIDGKTWDEYATQLQDNLQGLLNRFKDGTYYASPVRRVHIPKSDGRTRPIGIPTLEDKILQRAVVMVVEAVYEQDFKECSFGFRPKRSAHDGLQVLWDGLMKLKGGYVIDADIADFFGTLDHGHLRDFLDQRVTDGVLRKAIDKWLMAGVMDKGAYTRPESGTPQGGVISPLLANIYLHVVLDEWFARDVLPRLKGRAQLVRYADDFVVICEREDDANEVMAVLPKRLGKYGLSLHPGKTRLVRFKRPTRSPGDKRKDDDTTTPQTFDFLGFTHYWGVSRKKHVVCEPKHRERSANASAGTNTRMVSDSPTRSRERSAASVAEEDVRTLWVLRHHREFPWALALLLGGHENLVRMVASSVATGEDHVGAFLTYARPLPFAFASHADAAPIVSESVFLKSRVR